MKIKSISIAILSIILIIPFTVSADDSSKAYFSAGMMNMTDKNLDALKGAGVTIDDSSSVFNFTVGYKVSPNLALEGSIITGGEVSASLSGVSSGTLYGNTYSLSGNATIKANTDTTYLLGLKYSGGSGPLSINIKGGQLFWDVDYVADIKGTFTYAGTTYSVNELTFLTVDGSNPYFGLGVSYALSNNSSLDLDYISSEIHDADISGYSLSWVRDF